MKKILLSIIIVMMTGLLTACGEVSIDLNKYVTISVDGYNSLGTVTYNFDNDSFREDYADKIKVKKQTEEIKLEEAFGASPIEILKSYCISYNVEESSHLSNGDVVVFDWDCDVEAASEYFGCKLEFEDINYTVSGLQEIESFNPFDYLTIEFSGTSPVAMEEHNVDYSLPAMQYIQFRFDKSTGLALGDTITVTADIAPGMSVDEFVAKYNMIPGVTENTYTVENVAYYLTDVSQIPQENIDASIEDYQSYFIDYVYADWAKPETFQSVDYIGNYFLKTKDTSSLIGNYFYMIFKVKASHPVSNEPIEYYTYGYYRDVQNDGERVVMEDGTAPNTGWFAQEYFEIDGARYIGYQTIEELYENHIVSKIDSYEYVENIQE